MPNDNSKQPIRILHLSDIHFRAARKWDADPVLRALNGFIEEEVKAGLTPDLVAITGDLAFSGLAAEYKLARQWLDDLWPRLGGLDRDRLLLVPGNHDVDRSKVSRLAKLSQADLLEKKSQDEIANALGNEEDLRILLARHDAYLDFVGEWLGARPESPWWQRVIDICGSKIHVAGLDSAWMACGDDDRGKLLLSRYQLTQTVETKEAVGTDWKIALLHHPWDYLAELDSHSARSAVHQHCDLVLRGHLHFPQTERILPPDPNRACLELAAGCVYENSQYPNAFQWIELSPGKKRTTVHYRAWLHNGWDIDRNQPGCPQGRATFSLRTQQEPNFTLGSDEMAGPDIFISYARTDRPMAEQLAKVLEDLGWSVWWDDRLIAGETWDEVIETKLSKASCVVVLWSGASVGRKWVRVEASEGLKREILIPVRIEPVEQPLQFRLLQAEDLTGWSGNASHPNFERLKSAIEKKLQRSGKQLAQKQTIVEPPNHRSQGPGNSNTAIPGGQGNTNNKTNTPNGNEHNTEEKIHRRNWWKWIAAAAIIILAVSIIISIPPIKRLFSTYQEVREIGAIAYPTTGSVFQDFVKGGGDCPECPEMVVIPAGSFTMGSPVSEAERANDEEPQHQVRIGYSLAVGKYEVTFAEWDACVAAGGCGGYRPDDRGWGRGKRPVINVSSKDAQSYVEWLTKHTGKKYQLLSEAEWEYAARAGTTTPFAFGSTISPDQANYDGNYTYAGGPKGAYRQQTVAVGSFRPNAWGLYDMHGNVWEWVEDCWNGNYAGAPGDGSAWTSGDCSKRVLRGGSWIHVPRNLRSAYRSGYVTGDRFDIIGFRVARTN